jgi:hypothetical protein
MHTLSLNNHYANYSAGSLDRKELEVMLFEKARKEINTFNLPGWGNEDYDDYLSWLYPRLSRAVNTYRETGSSFETYIGSLVRLTVKEYRHRQARDYANETVAWSAIRSDMYTAESPPVYGAEYGSEYGGTLTAEKTAEKNEAVKNPRQLLILVLKCCNYVSPDFLERISQRLGVSAEVLDGMINRLKDGNITRMKVIEVLREKINLLFCRCMVYEKKLLSTEDETAARRVEGKLKRGRYRLAKLRVKLARTRPDPSNSRIAEILGVTKGTVDSALYSLRLNWNNTPANILN